MHSIFFTAGIVAIENWIKNKREHDKEQKEYLDGNIQILTYHNYGAFLNSGDKKPFWVKMISIFLTLGLTMLFALTFTNAN